jgi:hypothetical protein
MTTLKYQCRVDADVHRPQGSGQYPVLIAASPYPRQIQNLGAPAGFIEAGASDFFVPRGYVHVIANCRGTSGSGGTFGFFDGQERSDMYDLVEWAAQQPCSNGNVGMIGISYFAGTQMVVDVPSFNGATREHYPLPFLRVMGSSGLFEAWRVIQEGAISWFYEGTGGNFDYWPEGLDGPMRSEQPPFGNLALIADNDRMYHRIGRIGDPHAELPRMSASAH